MKTEQDEKTFSSTPLAIGAGTGLVFGAIAGPIGALFGSVAGAGIGFWVDSRESKLFETISQKKSSKKGSKKRVAHQH